MRGTPLARLLTMLKGELRVDADSTVAPGGDDVLNATLINMQSWLASEYDWPFLSLRHEMNVTPGVRYYDFPATNGVMKFNMERPIIFECYWSNLWYTVEMGIKLINYNTLNPELNQRLDPVKRIQPFNSTGDATQFEVWPLPATATRLRLNGQRALKTLGPNPADLDDQLIVLFAAAELLAGYGDNVAGAKAARAKERLNRLRAGIVGPSQVFSLRGQGGGSRSSKSIERPMVGVNYTPPT